MAEMRELPTVPLDCLVITKADTAQLMGGKKELLDCPFCGRQAMTIGTRNPDSGLFGYRATCSDWKCGASIHSCCHTPEEARAKVIERWNRRAGGVA